MLKDLSSLVYLKNRYLVIFSMVSFKSTIEKIEKIKDIKKKGMMEFDFGGVDFLGFGGANF